MKKTYRFAIESTVPSCSWIRDFIDEIKASKGNSNQIAWACEMLKANTFREARRIAQEFDEIKNSAEYILLPFLEPAFHIDDHLSDEPIKNHYLKDIGRYTCSLLTDPKTIVVYDYGSLPKWSSNKTAATQMTMDTILTFWCNEIGPQRVLSRKEALKYILTMMRPAAAIA